MGKVVRLKQTMLVAVECDCGFKGDVKAELWQGQDGVVRSRAECPSCHIPYYAFVD